MATSSNRSSKRRCDGWRGGDNVWFDLARLGWIRTTRSQILVRLRGFERTRDRGQAVHLNSSALILLPFPSRYGGVQSLKKRWQKNEAIEPNRRVGGTYARTWIAANRRAVSPREL